jgi:acyl-lipid omega-6 desaturase (Delta-12 desaturase)
LATAQRVAPSRKELVSALAPFAVPDTRTGLRLFAIDLAVYMFGLALALFATDTPWRVFGSLLVGLKMGALYTLAHDAAHNSLTASRGLNKALGIVGYVASLHNYRLRLFDHLVLGHHPRLNGPQPDAYRPMSWQAYRDAPPWRRAWERATRAPHVLAFAPYGIVSRWLRAEVAPSAVMPAAARVQAWAHGAFVLAYVVAIVGWLGYRNGGDPSALALDVLLVIGLPFYMMQSAQAAILFFQHTHPRIPWFGPGDPRIDSYGPELLTVHVRVPKLVGTLTHDLFEHPAHHIVPAIPCYRLRAAQARLNELVGESGIGVDFSPGALFAVMRRCKVYDYERHLWLDFEGRPTSKRTVRDTHQQARAHTA